MQVMRPEALPWSINGLRSLIDHLPHNCTMAEIGCFLGESTRIFAESEKIVKIIAIDAFDFSYSPGEDVGLFEAEKIKDMFVENVVNKFEHKVLFLRNFSVPVPKEIEDRSLDFVYIDGNHSYESVKADITAYLPKIKIDGMIGGHDYTSHFPGVVRAVNEIFGSVSSTFEDSSWLKKL